MATYGYVDDADFSAWLAERGYSVSGTVSALLIRAFDWVELQAYKGRKTSSTQDNQWPRTSVYIDGYLVDSSAIPDQVKELQMRYAYDLDAGNDAMAVGDQREKSFSIDGAISVEYADGSYQPTLSGQTQLLLAKLTETGGGMSFRVSRG